MEEKTFVASEEDFYKKFSLSFNDIAMTNMAWEIIQKPIYYPCIVIKTCGKYIYIYQNDFLLN